MKKRRRAAKRPRKIEVRSRFVLEAETVRAILLTEGRSKNRNDWTRSALEQVAKVIDGVPINLYDMSRRANQSFLAHWESLRERLPPAIRAMLPERLPDAEIGKVRNARVEVGSDGKARVESDVEVSAEKLPLLRAIWEQAKRLGRSLGVSIHVPADGMTAEPLDGGGLRPLTIDRVVGFDVVTFPSAGGTLTVLEALAEDREMKLIARLLRLLPKAKRPVLLEAVQDPDSFDTIEGLVEGARDFVDALLEALDVEAADEHLVPVLEALYKSAPADDTEPEPKRRRKAPKKAKAAKPALEDEDADDDDPPVVKRDEFDGLTDNVKRLLRQNGVQAINVALESSGLPEPLIKVARKQLTRELDATGIIESERVEEFVADLKKGLGDSRKASKSLLEDGPQVIPGDFTSGERAVAAFEAMTAGQEYGEVEVSGKKERVPAFRGIKEAYQILTGDFLMRGQSHFANRRRQRGALESVNFDESPTMREYLARRGIVGGDGGGLLEDIHTQIAGFASLMADTMHRQMVREYIALAHLWSVISRTESVSDFKTWRWERIGEFSNLADISEKESYVTNDLGDLTPAEEITLAVTKRGGTATISWETIVNDDTRTFRNIPGKLARAAERTINAFCWTKIIGTGAGDTTIYDAVALAHATHGNLVSAAYSDAALKTARKQMTQQKDLSDAEAGRAIARHVFAGPEQVDPVYEDMFSDGKPNLAETGEIGTAAMADRALTLENPGKANVLRSRYGLDLYELHYFDETGDPDRVLVTGDPSEIEMLSVAFLNGMRNPSLFVQDLEKVGSFFETEQIIHKIRHIYDAVVMDYRGFQVIVPP